MAYEILDLELTNPLPDPHGNDRAGVAVIARRKGRALGFLMRSLDSGPALDRAELARWVAGEVGTRWVQESLREELGIASTAERLPSLTVTVCTKDRPDSLRRCLQSLVASREPPEAPDSEWEAECEILVVDNAPSDQRTEEVVSEFQDVRRVLEPRPGLNFARNRAMQEARGELLAYIDDDVVVDRFWWRGLREAWSTHPDAAAFTGQVLPLEMETEAQVIFEQRGGFRHGFEAIRYTQSVPAGDDGFLYPCCTGIFGVGCNMAFRRASLMEIGGFDEALDTGRPLPGGGDHDIFYRIIRAGYPLVYDPGILVFHRHRRTLKELRRQYRTWGRSIMAVASKERSFDHRLRFRWLRLTVAWFTSHLREMIAALFCRRRVPARFVFWEIIGGLVGLCGEYRRSRRRISEIQRRFP